MANAFQKAKAAATAEPTVTKKASKETKWLVGNDPVTQPLAEAVSEMVKLHAERKQIETQEEILKARLKNFAMTQWQTAFASTGIPPETPMKIVNRATGQSVTFVVQDRSQGKDVTDDVLEALTGLMGPPAVDEAIIAYDEYRFDPVTMASPTANDPNKKVEDVVGDELGKMQERLIKQGVLTETQAANLIGCTTLRTYRPGFLLQLPRLCANSVSRFCDALGVVGSAIVTYVRA